MREVGQALLVLLVCAAIIWWMGWFIQLGHGG